MNAAPATKFTPPILSLLSIVEDSEPVNPVNDFDPKEIMFTSFADAIAWRNTLNDEQAAYFSKIDKFILGLVPGRIVEINKKVPDPAQRRHFYRCLSYIMLACDLFGDISFNDDFTRLKLNYRWQPK